MYPLVLHKSLTSEKWESYSKSKQVLMIANELNRAAGWLKKNQDQDAAQCYERAFELTDLTINDPKWCKSLKELLRFREILGDLYITKNPGLNESSQSNLINLTSGSFNLLKG